MGKEDNSRQVNNKKTVQVRVDLRTHYYAKIKASQQSTSLRRVVDRLLCDWLGEELSKDNPHAF